MSLNRTATTAGSHQIPTMSWAQRQPEKHLTNAPVEHHTNAAGAATPEERSWSPCSSNVFSV